MRLYLTPAPSIEIIRYLRSVNGEDGIGGKPMRKRVLRDAINTARAVQELDATAQNWLSHIEGPVHAYVNDRSRGTRTSDLVTHVLSTGAPHGAFLDLGHNVCICSPQFAFTQLAANTDLLDVVRLGMELCGAYSYWRLEPDIGSYPLEEEQISEIRKALSAGPSVYEGEVIYEYSGERFADVHEEI